MKTTLLTALTTLCLTACATSPTGRSQLRLLPDDQMNAMGSQAFDELKQKQKISYDAKTNAYVKCVADEITAVLPEKQSWEVVVFDIAEPNAFALPGGKIGVHTGMLKVARTPGQLGAVLGHEVGHVLAHHSNERVSETTLVETGTALLATVFTDKNSRTYRLTMAALGVGSQFGILLPHSRKQESEADVIGLRLMSQAGFDPRQAVELWRNMQSAAGGGSPPEFMSTHPSNQTRIDRLQAQLSEVMPTYEQAKRRPACQAP